MIREENFAAVLLAVGFVADDASATKPIYRKEFEAGSWMVADFAARCLAYPTLQGLKINTEHTLSFKAPENFVVFECINRLLTKGYQPQQLEIERPFPTGHGTGTARADVLVVDNTGAVKLIIECKTAGKEFTSAWADTLADGGQLFGYAHQWTAANVCLYASDWVKGETGYEVRADYRMISLEDKPKLLDAARGAGRTPTTYQGVRDAAGRFRVWTETYDQEASPFGIFETSIAPFEFGLPRLTVEDLRPVSERDIQGKYHEFAIILRQHNVSGRENAFDKLVNLFLCKIVDEEQYPTELRFGWRGAAADDAFQLQDRLQQLYRDGMRRMLNEEVTYIDETTIRSAFAFVANRPDATREAVLHYFRQQKFFTSNDFAFIDVHNEKLFWQNAAILRPLIQMLEGMRLRTSEPNQFLGDLFEGFLDQGVKQSEGQFFTPLPIVRFLLRGLPLSDVVQDATAAGYPVRGLDYACGSGHFLTELAQSLTELQPDTPHPEAGLVGLEKEYRLSKVAKVAAYMSGHSSIRIIHHDALTATAAQGTPDHYFQVLVANPPYSVKGFLQTLREPDRLRFKEVTGLVKEKAYGSFDDIETLFVLRAAQVLAPGGVAAIVLPSSLLSNGAAAFVAARETLLAQFDIIALAALGSGTFGKTGTNTVTLFLRRRHLHPAPAEHYAGRVRAWFSDGPAALSSADPAQATYQDAHLLGTYCQHQGWEEADYQALLAGVLSEALAGTELFKDYRKAFDKGPAVTDRRKQRTFKQLSEAEQEADLDRLFVEWVREREQDKVLTYVLASLTPRPVVLIKSPEKSNGGTEAVKDFLGYEFSDTKGREGIKYRTLLDEPAKAKRVAKNAEDDSEDTEAEAEEVAQNLSALNQINSLLYDPQEPLNPDKLNTYVQANFRGEEFTIPEALAPYLSTAPLTDLLDFGRVAFPKTIATTPQVHITFDTDWSLMRLEDLATLMQRGKGTTYAGTGIQIIKSGQARGGQRFDLSETFRAPADFDPGDRRLRPGDLLINSTGVGTAGRVTLFDLSGDFAPDSHITILRLPDATLARYLLYVLWHAVGFKRLEALGQGSSGQIEITLEALRRIKVPVAPDTTQLALVAACQAIEDEVTAAEQTVAAAKAEIAVVFSPDYPRQRLQDAVARVSDTIDPQLQTGDILYIGLENIESGTGQLVGELITPYRRIKSLKTRFEAGDILYGKLRPNLNKVWLANESGICSTEILVFRPHTAALATFYSKYFLTSVFNQRVIQDVSGQQLPRTSWEKMEVIPVPVPDEAHLAAVTTQLSTLEARIVAAQTVINGAAARKTSLVLAALRREPPPVPSV